MKLISFNAILMIFTGCLMTGQDWPQYLGPNRDGTVSAPGLFDGHVSLERLWIQPLGSGFSGIAVGGGKLYTMHVAGAMDALSCFDAATGNRLWSFEYGTSFPKVGNSEPGPLSTPLLDGNRVFGLGARGELFCLDAQGGQRIWARNIAKELGATEIPVGMTTSPLVSGDFLILNLGDRKDKSIAAFHKKTGLLAWHMGDEKITFQSPSLVTLLGRRQVVALSATVMRGIDPTTGALLWEKDSREWIQMFAVGDDLMLTGHYHGIALQRLQEVSAIRLQELGNIGLLMDDAAKVKPGAKYKIRELWYTQNLALEYDMPVHHQGYLYGFEFESLTCLELATGKTVWASAKPGRGMAILADGHLAIISADGVFRIARAWEKGYEERTSIQVFQKSGLTAPSYADGVFYLRSYTHLAAVKVN